MTYNIKDPILKSLPTIHTRRLAIKVSVGNECVVCGQFLLFFFLYYTDNYGCINCIGNYGSYLGIQDKYKISVEDDLEYLYNSDFSKRI
jgi:hypothetical protein